MSYKNKYVHTLVIQTSRSPSVFVMSVGALSVACIYSVFVMSVGALSVACIYFFFLLKEARRMKEK